jgi:hydrogenase small subunit
MKLVWVHGITCCGNTHSFLNYEYLDSLLKKIDILYHPSLSVEEGNVLDAILEEKIKLDVLIVEGAVSKEDEKVKKLCHLADFVIAVGNCACYGNIPALTKADVGGLQFRFKNKGGLLGEDFVSKGGYPVINLSGCPAHPDWIVGVLLSLYNGEKLELDQWNRPKTFYSSLTHWGCTRNEYFEWKVEMEKLGSKKGCLFYYFGCRGPMTYSSCNRILWNAVSSKTRAGTPCFGCTEFDFPRIGLFETKLFAGLPVELPIGVSKRGYIMLAGIAKTFAPERLKLED